MTHWRSIALAVLVLLGVSLTAHAQDPSAAWEVLLYNNETQEFVTVTQDGIIAAQPLPIEHDEDDYFAFDRSESGRYLAILKGGPGGSVQIADWTGNSCCVTLSSLVAEPNIEYVDARFSPDESQIAVSYVAYPGDNTLQGGILIADRATGQILTQLPSSTFGQITALLGAWRADGLRFVPTCWGCEGVIDGRYSLWNPQTNTVIATDESFSHPADVLSATGEVLMDKYNSTFPRTGFPGMFEADNTVAYYPAGQPFSMFDDGGQTIYFKPAHEISWAAWVADGDAALVLPYTPAPATLLFRDGSQMEVGTDVSGVQFVAATPAGWLWNEEGSLVVFRLDAATKSVTSAVLGQFSSTLYWVVISHTELTPNVAPGMAHQLTPPNQVAVTCPGFMPSRLEPFTYGRVTPGDPNSLRAGPGTSFPKVGELPGETVFSVMNGPTCAENMAWWEVEYYDTNGMLLRGWTSEGQGQTYWLEPV